MKKLLKPLEWEKGIMRAFFEGCGATLEIKRKLAETYGTVTNVELPNSLNNFYFKNRGCGLRDRCNNVRPIELIHIPQHAKIIGR